MRVRESERVRGRERQLFLPVGVAGLESAAVKGERVGEQEC